MWRTDSRAAYPCASSGSNEEDDEDEGDHGVSSDLASLISIGRHNARDEPRSGVRAGRGWLWILQVSVQPVVHLPEHVENRLSRRVSMRLQRQQHKAHRTALAFDRAKKALALDRERALV